MLFHPPLPYLNPQCSQTLNPKCIYTLMTSLLHGGCAGGVESEAQGQGQCRQHGAGAAFRRFFCQNSRSHRCLLPPPSPSLTQSTRPFPNAAILSPSSSSLLLPFALRGSPCGFALCLVVMSAVCMGFARSAHTLRVQLSGTGVSACWRSEIGWDMLRRYLTLAGKPVISIVIDVFCMLFCCLLPRRTVMT